MWACAIECHSFTVHMDMDMDMEGEADASLRHDFL